MTRDLLIVTKSSVRRYTLGKAVRPLTTLNSRLYRTDECLMVSDRESDAEFIAYDVDQTRPYFIDQHPELIHAVNPDKTFAYIDTAKQAGTGVSKLGWLSQISGMHIMYAVIGIVVVYSVIEGGFP